jgi:hypothetical protein
VWLRNDDGWPHETRLNVPSGAAHFCATNEEKFKECLVTPISIPPKLPTRATSGGMLNSPLRQQPFQGVTSGLHAILLPHLFADIRRPVSVSRIIEQFAQLRRNTNRRVAMAGD